AAEGGRAGVAAPAARRLPVLPICVVLGNGRGPYAACVAAFVFFAFFSARSFEVALRSASFVASSLSVTVVRAYLPVRPVPWVTSLSARSLRRLFRVHELPCDFGDEPRFWVPKAFLAISSSVTNSPVFASSLGSGSVARTACSLLFSV